MLVTVGAVNPILLPMPFGAEGWRRGCEQCSRKEQVRLAISGDNVFLLHRHPHVVEGGQTTLHANLAGETALAFEPFCLSRTLAGGRREVTARSIVMMW